jgi:hypothetical protein
MNWYRGPKRKKGEKYGNKKVETDGYSFASGLEAALYEQLKLRKLTGEIESIKVQAKVLLTDAKILYKPDFECVRTDGTKFWAESKGFETSDWRIKRRLWMHYGPGPLEIWKGSAKRLTLAETLIPEREPIETIYTMEAT